MQQDQNSENKNDQSPEVWVADSEETKKSMDTGKKVIDLNKKLASQDGKDAEGEEKKDEQKWREEK